MEKPPLVHWYVNPAPVVDVSTALSPGHRSVRPIGVIRAGGVRFTVTFLDAEQPVLLWKVIVVTPVGPPAASAVTVVLRPDAVPVVATAVLLLVHVPVPEAPKSENVAVDPWHMVLGPVIAGTPLVTVTVVCA